MSEPTGKKPTVENRWWAEIGGKSGTQPAPKRGPTPVDRLFKIVEGYDQDQARDNLTDLNLRLLHHANPAEGEWGYIQLLPARFSPRQIDKIKRQVDLPAYARGLVVDSGRTVRLLVTGTPLGERLLELALLDVPSFDCWIRGEWVKEELYKHPDQALSRFRRHIRGYLSPEGIAAAAATSAQA